jgi:hypothetical protein
MTGVRLPRDLVDVAARVRVEAQHVGAGALRHEGHEGVERVVLEEAAGVDELADGAGVDVGGDVGRRAGGDRGEQDLLGRAAGRERLHPDLDVGVGRVPVGDHLRREGDLLGVRRRPEGDRGLGRGGGEQGGGERGRQAPDHGDLLVVGRVGSWVGGGCMRSSLS